MKPEEVAHKNSRKITIFRSQSFLGKIQTGLDDYYANSQRPIGSYYDSVNSQQVGTGLELDEIELLLPELIDFVPADKDFKKEVKIFFNDISTKVPYATGAVLETGLRKNNDEPISKENMPISIMDYIRWRHAKNHPWVAASREDASGNPLVEYYISDPERIKQAGKSARELKEQAMEQYLVLTKLKDDTQGSERLDDIIAVIGSDPRLYKSRDEKLDFLNDLANNADTKKVQDFYDVVTDKSLELKGLAEKLVITGILKKIGSRYLIAETDTILGDSLEEVLLELADEKNSQQLIVFKSQLQEKMKARVAGRRK